MNKDLYINMQYIIKDEHMVLAALFIASVNDW